MANEDLALCNEALVLLGEEKLTSLSDTDEPTAIIANTLYTRLTNGWLACYPWSFAKKKASLAETTAPLTVWENAFTLPTGLLVNYAAYPDDAVGTSPTQDYDLQDGKLLTNHPAIWLDYLYRPAESAWPAYFNSAVIFGLAASFSLPITDDDSKFERFHRTAFGLPEENGMGGEFGKAMRADSQQKPNSVIFRSPLIEARRGAR